MKKTIVPLPTEASEVSNDEIWYIDEIDPTVPSYVKSITQSDITKWNTPAILTETDPTVPAHVKKITQADITKWNTPAILTETDPTVPAHVKKITQADITKWNTPAILTETDPTVPAHVKKITQQELTTWRDIASEFYEVRNGLSQLWTDNERDHSVFYGLAQNFDGLIRDLTDKGIIN